MTVSLWSFLLAGLVVGCQSNTPNTTTNETEAATPMSHHRTPERWVEAEGQKVGWYTYDQLRPLLELDNDTTYVVNFWATWCKPCIEEMPAFQQLYQAYKGQKVHLMLVSLDFEKQLTSKLIPFLNQHDIQGEVVVLSQKGMNDWMGDIASNWSGAIPATLIYQGKRRQFYEQSFDYGALELKLRKFMNLL